MLGKAPRLLLVGDSHAAGLAPVLGTLVKQAGWEFTYHSDVGKDLRWFGQQSVLDDLVSDFKPNVIVIVLGTNPTGAGSERTPASYNLQIADILKKTGKAKVVWVGPPTILNDPTSDAAVATRSSIFAQRRDIALFIDSRELTKSLDAYRTPEGVHFTVKGYELWANRIFERLPLNKWSSSSWKKWATVLSLAGLAVVGTLYLWKGTNNAVRSR